MNEQQALSLMVPPGTPREGKFRRGVIQVWTTRSCDLSCYGCTQGSNLAAPLEAITPYQFEKACLSLRTYWGVIGMFGGNPATHKQFDVLCEILRGIIPFEQRGLWCNNPLGWGKVMRQTFNPAVSNLNVHLNRKAYDEFKRDWPECRPVGLEQDSRHSPPFVAMKDLNALPSYSGGPLNEVENNEENRWDLISRCDINQHWSAMIGVFRGELRAWFCEVAGAQAMLHQYDPDYPDTGLDLKKFPVYPGHAEFDIRGDRTDSSLKEFQWWECGMGWFAPQVRQHCHSCSIPLRGYGELAQSTNPDSREQTSETHAGIYVPKRKGRRVELVTLSSQLGNPLGRVTSYLQNAKV